MVRFGIYPKKTALLVIDMQNAFLKPGSVTETPAGRELIPKLKKLMRVCRNKGIPVIFTKHVHREDGSDTGIYSEFVSGKVIVAGTEDAAFYNEIQPEEGDIIVEKCRFSAFFSTDLDLILRRKGIDTLIISGLCTHVCCESTARDAQFRDYKVVFLSDGNAARGLPDMGWGQISPEEVQSFVLTNLAYLWAHVLSIDEPR